MKIKYEFVNGETSEIEVDDSLGELLVDFDRQQYNNDHKETRRHVSLDGMDYEGELFVSAEDTAGGPAAFRHGGPLPCPAGAGVKSLF